MSNLIPVMVAIVAGWHSIIPVQASTVQDEPNFVVTVSDDYTDMHIEGAEVRLLQGGTIVETVFTNEQGIALFAGAATGVAFNPDLPVSFSVGDNYPNPFHSETSIEVALPADETLTAEVYNVFGQRVAVELLALAGGRHTVHVTLGQFPAGVYFLRVSGAESVTAKLLKTGAGAYGTGPALSVRQGATGPGFRIAANRADEEYTVEVVKNRYDTVETGTATPGDTVHVAMSRNNQLTLAVDEGTVNGVAYEVYITGLDEEISTTTPDVLILKSGFYIVEANAHAAFFESIIEIPSVDTVLVFESPGMPPDDGVTSFDRITEALENGDIDEEAALIYQVFASFNDTRLPNQYRGDDSEFFSGKIQLEAMNRYDELSAEAREVIGPFLVPAYYEGSWWDFRHDNGAATGKMAASTAPCLPREVCRKRNELWDFVESEKIKVWYRGCLVRPDAENPMQVQMNELCETFNRNRRNQAVFHLELAEETWEKLTELGFKEPLPDHFDPRTEQPIPNHGGDSRLDIILVSEYDIGDWGKTFSYTGRYEETPAFVTVAQGLAPTLSTAVLIHEVMHAFQFAYDLHMHHTNYDWLMEATANWAIDYVRPDNQWEHRQMLFKRILPFLHTTDRSLDDTFLNRHYSAYIWPFYLSHNHNPAIIKGIFDRIHDSSSLQANELALRAQFDSDKGFQEVWPEFAVLNLNRDDIEQTRKYRIWDPAEPVLTIGVETEPEDLSLSGAVDGQVATLTSDIRYLASNYAHFRFTDQNIRSVAFFDGYTAQLDLMAGLYMTSPLNEEQREGLNVQALVKIQGRNWELQDWTDKPVVSFCRELDSQNVEELIIVSSNSMHAGVSENYPEATWRGNQQPIVHYSNMSCAGWSGTLTGVWPGDVEERVMMNVTFEALPYPDILEASAHFGQTYRLVAGSLDWQISGEQEGCTVTGNAEGIPLPDNRLMATNNFVPTPGMFARQAWFNIAWDSAGEDAVIVTQLWNCAGDSFEVEDTIGHFWVHITDAEVEDDGTTISGHDDDYGHRSIEWTWHFTADPAIMAATE